MHDINGGLAEGGNLMAGGPTNQPTLLSCGIPGKRLREKYYCTSTLGQFELCRTFY